jgi:hypothetical protein
VRALQKASDAAGVIIEKAARWDYNAYLCGCDFVPPAATAT